MINSIPLSDACFSEVLARVSFRVLHRWVVASDYGYRTPVDAMAAVANDLADNGWPVLQMWVLGYRRLWRPGYTTRDVRDQFIVAARQGHTWRRVVFPDYKSTRRDPRVTNRGVAHPDTLGEV